MIVNRWIHYIVFLLSPALVLGVGTASMLPFFDLKISESIMMIVGAIIGLVVNLSFVKMYEQKRLGNIRAGLNENNIIYSIVLCLIVICLILTSISLLFFVVVGLIPALLTALASDLLTLYWKLNKTLWIVLTAMIGSLISFIFDFMSSGIDSSLLTLFSVVGAICALFSSISLVIHGNFRDQ